MNLLVCLIVAILAAVDAKAVNLRPPFNETLAEQFTRYLNEAYEDMYQKITRKNAPVKVEGTYLKVPVTEPNINLVLRLTDSKMWLGELSAYWDVRLIDMNTLNVTGRNDQKNMKIAGNLKIEGKINGTDVSETRQYQLLWGELGAHLLFKLYLNNNNITIFDDTFKIPAKPPTIIIEGKDLDGFTTTEMSHAITIKFEEMFKDKVDEIRSMLEQSFAELLNSLRSKKKKSKGAKPKEQEQTSEIP